MTVVLGLVFAIAFALLVTPSITAERWLASMGVGTVIKDHPAPLTVRIPAFSGFESPEGNLRNGSIIIARGEIATADDAATVESIAATTPQGALPYVAFFVLALTFGIIFAHHMRRSTKGKLVRVQLVSLIGVAVLAGAVKVVLLGTALSVLVVPVAVFALVPTLVLDRVVGLATGILAALVVSLLGPFDLGVAILMLVQASTAGLVVAERPRRHWKTTLFAGLVTTAFTVATYVLLSYLTTGTIPALGDPLRSPWLAAAIGPAIATLIAVPLVPLYQLAVGEITQGKLVELEDLSNPLLKQIAERSPGTWQHSLAMANMAEIAANSIGANGRLVRVGAYYHDLGKSLTPKYFIENLEPGETSPHDRLPPEVSCDAIFAHVTEGIVHARKAGLHERIVDFMHMHHGNGVLEYFWGKVKEQGNPNGFTVEDFRYPGHPPQSRETAILAICDAVEAASRTLKNPTPASIDSLVQRIVYGKLHLGQLDESGLSMSDLRCVSDSLRETIRHANHGRIEYPWQKAQQDASAGAVAPKPSNDTSQLLRLDSLDRRPVRRTASSAAVEPPPATPSMSMPIELGPSERKSQDLTRPAERISQDLTRPADRISAPRISDAELAIVETAPQTPPPKTDWPAQTSVGVGPVPAQVAATPKPASHVGPLPKQTDDDDFEREAARPVDELPVGVRAQTASTPPGPAPDVISPQTFGARTKAATLSPPPRATPAVPRTLPGPGSPPSTLAGTAIPEQRTSGLASGPIDKSTLLGQGTPDAPPSPAERRRAQTVPSDPPLNQPKPQSLIARNVIGPAGATLAPPGAIVRPADPAAWRADGGEPRRPGDHDSAPLRGAARPGQAGAFDHDSAPLRGAPSRVSGLPAEPPGSGGVYDTLRGGNAPARLPASPEPPPKFPAEPSPHLDASSPNLPPAQPSATPSRLSGPPEPVELENAITNPPPLRRGSGSQPPLRDTPHGVRRLPGILLESEAVAHDARMAADQPLDTLQDNDDIRVTAPRIPVGASGAGGGSSTFVGHMSGQQDLAHLDAGRTEPSMPRVDQDSARLRGAARPGQAGAFDLPLRAPPTDPPIPQGRDTTWGKGLASRVDAVLDEWGLETPVAPPSRAELRSLLGVPDVTKEQSIAELERLHDRTRELQSDPAIFPPRAIHDTHEVDPDDIEASIEVAPRARTQAPASPGRTATRSGAQDAQAPASPGRAATRSGAQNDRSPSAIGVAKPKKP